MDTTAIHINPGDNILITDDYDGTAPTSTSADGRTWYAAKHRIDGMTVTTVQQVTVKLGPHGEILRDLHTDHGTLYGYESTAPVLLALTTQLDGAEDWTVAVQRLGLLGWNTIGAANVTTASSAEAAAWLYARTWFPPRGCRIAVWPADPGEAGEPAYVLHTPVVPLAPGAPRTAHTADR